MILSITTLLLAVNSWSQSRVVVTVDKEKETSVLVKWYFQGLITPGGCNVYRQEKGSDQWMKVNGERLEYKGNAITAPEKRADKELEGYSVLAADPRAMKGLPLIALLVKSFTCKPLARYLGILAQDTLIEDKKSYRYRVTRLNNGKEVQEGVSDWLTTGHFEPLPSPEGLELKGRKKSVLLRWKPEPDRYYAVHIYRKTGDTGVFRRITKDPILLSKTKTASGVEEFPAFFFEDQGLPSQISLSYRLQGIDFFGYETKFSEEKKITLADLQPPTPATGITCKVDGRKVRLCWKKDSLENDLAGFRIYRTTRNDTDYRVMNKVLLQTKETCYKDSVIDFGQFFYRVASVDVSGNEGRSNPQFVDVFDNEPPAAPEKVVIRADTGRLVISWKNNREKDIDGYLLYKTVNGDDPATYVKITPRPVSCCSFTEQMAAKIGNRFFYKVVAVDQSMNRSAYSIAASAKMPDKTPPSQPFLSSVDVVEEIVVVSWFLNPETDVMSYEVFRSKDGEEKLLTRINRQTLSREVTSFADEPGQDAVYAYRVSVLDSSGNRSVYSNEVRVRYHGKVKTEGADPVLEARYNERKKEVHLEWEGKVDGQFYGYMIYRAEGNENYESITGLLSRESCTDKSVKNDSHYRYQVRQYSKSGQVLRSKEIKIITKS